MSNRGSNRSSNRNSNNRSRNNNNNNIWPEENERNLENAAEMMAEYRNQQMRAWQQDMEELAREHEMANRLQREQEQAILRQQRRTENIARALPVIPSNALEIVRNYEGPVNTRLVNVNPELAGNPWSPRAERKRRTSRRRSRRNRKSRRSKR